MRRTLMNLIKLEECLFMEFYCKLKLLQILTEMWTKDWTPLQGSSIHDFHNCFSSTHSEQDSQYLFLANVIITGQFIGVTRVTIVSISCFPTLTPDPMFCHIIATK